MRSLWLASGFVVLAVFLLGHEAVAQTSPDPAASSGPSSDGASTPQTLPPVRVSAPKSATRPPPKRKPPVHAAISSPAIPVAKPSGAPNVGSGTAGGAQTASQTQATGEELNARPVTRPGEILEATPGLIVTQHSGEGKANQYFLRGYNLDHGTDMAIWVDDVPVNMRTHAHGQGYADLNWLMPETVNSLDIRKGPYFADEGDFASAGNLHIGLIDSVPKAIAEVTAGRFGYERFFGMDSAKAGNGNLLIAAEIGTYNGPWVNPDEMRKYNGMVRYTEGTATDGFSVTGMAYSNKWNSTDQVPERAITSSQIGLFGSEDPTDGGNTNRFALSARMAESDDIGSWKASAYVVKSQLDLFNDFTYFLTNPVLGDQFHQHDDRIMTGANASRTFDGALAGLPMETTIGA